MAKAIKSAKGKIVAIILAILVVAGAIGAYFIFRKDKNNEVVDSPYLAAICRNRVQNAQYLPNVNKFASDQVATTTNYQSSNSSRIENIDKTITLENFNTVIEEIGDIDSPFDRELTISDVKEEVYKVLSNTSIFGEWINFFDGELQGYGDYFVSYDQETEHITIMRNSGFQPWVYDSATGKIVSNDDFDYDENRPNYPILEEIIYKIDYYYNEQGVEVVECEIVNFLNYYEDTMYVMYQYIKNVKDTSFTKYIIEPITYLSSTAGDGSWGYDIDTNNPLGTVRQFIQMDYTNKDDVSLLFVKQGYASAHNSVQDSTAINFYRKLNNELYLYNSIYCYGDSYSVGQYFVNSSSSTLFNIYLNNNNYYSGALVGTPDENYLTRSTDTIQRYTRELYYTNGTNQLSVSPGTYYLKADSDDDECFYKLQNMPLVINQTFTSLAKNTKMADSKINQVLQQSPEFLDVSDTTFKVEYETFIDGYLAAITQNIVDNSYLKNNYSTFKNAKCLIVYPNNTSAIKDYISLQDFESTSSLENSQLTYSASAKISSSILLNEKAQYQLSLVAQGDGNNFVLLQKGESVKYNGEDFVITTSGNYDIADFRAYIEDSYTISIVLTITEKAQTILCSEVKELTFDNIPSITIENGSNNGFEYSYEVKEDNGALRIVTTSQDTQSPTISASATIILPADSTIADLVKELTIKDNGKMVSVVISKDSTVFYRFDNVVETGTYKITAVDFAGNSFELEISVQVG